MKKILMLIPLLVFLAGCSKTDDSMTSPPADAPAATNTNAAPPAPTQ